MSNMMKKAEFVTRLICVIDRKIEVEVVGEALQDQSKYQRRR